MLIFIFFFQAEDGIRDLYVTGVQTCALPISGCPPAAPAVPGCSCVPLAQQDHGQGQRGRRPGAQHRETGPRGQRVAPPGGRADVAHLRVVRNGLLYGKARDRGQPQQPLIAGQRQQVGDRDEVRQDDHHDDEGDRDRAAPQRGADGHGEDGGDGEHRSGAGHQAHLGQRVHRVDVVAVVARYPGRERDRDDGGHQPGHEGGRGEHDGLRGLAASVVRISPRRYSAVMYIAPTTTTAISPKKVPTRANWMLRPGPAPPSISGAMSPDPVTVKAPPDWWYPPPCTGYGLLGPPAPMTSPRHPPAGHAPRRPT